MKHSEDTNYLSFCVEQDQILAEIPIEFRSMVSAKAWEDGHSCGYSEVLLHARNLVEELKDPLESYTTRIRAEASDLKVNQS